MGNPESMSAGVHRPPWRALTCHLAAKTPSATPLPPVAGLGLWTRRPPSFPAELTAPAKGSQREKDQGVCAPHGGRAREAARGLVADRWAQVAASR